MVPYPWPWYKATKQTWLLTNQETPDKGKDISSYSTFKRCLLTSYDNHESVSSRNPKNCSNKQETFSALELQAYPRYIFSGFELPSKHSNHIFVHSILYIHFDLENELHHALTTTKRYWPRIWAKYNSLLLPTPISWHETLRKVTQSSQTSLASLNSMGFHSLSVLNTHLTFYEEK
jgi:hypothetical protein